MSPQIVEQPQINWEMMRLWQVWDPVPEWWRLDEGMMKRVIQVQFDHRLKVMELEMEQLRQVRDLVVG